MTMAPPFGLSDLPQLGRLSPCRLSVLLSATVLACGLQGCMGVPAPAPIAQRQAGMTLTCVIDTRHSSLYKRGVLALTPTRKIKVSVEAPDLKDPFSTIKSLDSLEGGVRLTVDGIPKGKLRVVTLQWLDDAEQPIDGLYYRAQGTLDDFNQTLKFNNLSTAEGEVLLAVMKAHPEAASVLLSEDIHTWISSVVKTTRVPNPRFLDVAAVAEAIVGLSTKTDASGKPTHIPVPIPAWGFRPGFVAVGFKDIQPDLRLRVSVNDPASGAGETASGDTLVLGPTPPRDAAYRLSVQVLPSADELIGPDLVLAPVEVKVVAGQTTVVAPISLARSTPGAPMPERIGRGGAAVVAGAENQLWILNGVKYDTAKATATVPIIAADQAYRYRASDGWSTPAKLPPTFPLYGAATAAAGSRIFAFGGFVDQAPSGVVTVFETSGTAGLQADVIALPAVDGETKPTLANAVAASLNDRIYVTGGVVHDDVAPDPDGSPGDNGMRATLVFDPAAKTFDAPLAGPPQPLKSMAGAVVAGKWYLFGGFRFDRMPNGAVQIFDAATKSWAAELGKPMPTPRYGCATAVVDGKVWVIGGETLRGAPSRAVEVYDPATDVWTRRAPLRTPCSYAAAATVNLGGVTKILVAGGVAGVSPAGFPMPLDPTLVEELTP